MRLAICAASPYESSPGIPRLASADLDLEVMSSCLSAPDKAYSVHTLPAQRGLGQSIEEIVVAAGGPLESLVIYFSGYVLWPEDRGPGLLLDGERMATLSLKRLNRLLNHYAEEALVILDLALLGDSTRSPAELIAGVGAMLAGSESNVSALVAVRASVPSDAIAPSSFTNVFGFVLDWQNAGPDGVTAASLFEAVRAESIVFEDVPVSEFFAGSRPVFVMPPSTEATRELTRSSPPPGAPTIEELAAAAEARALADAGAVQNAWAMSELSAQCLARGDFASAAEHARAAVRTEPKPEYLRLALATFEKLGESDAAWHAASALDYLGEADINESLVASQHRPEGLIAANGSLTDEDWGRGHFWPERDANTAELVNAINGAAVEVGMAAARRKGRILELDPADAQDPERSTTTLAKTLVWTSRLLGVTSPTLYVLPEVPGDLKFAPSRNATVLASRSVGSGLGLPELAFLWGRQLAYGRPEHYIVAFFPEALELADLIDAAHGIGGRSRDALRTFGRETKRLASDLKKRVRGPDLERLKEAVRAQPSSEALPRARAYLKSVELAGVRAGLLACGSLETAAKLTERFPLGQELDVKRQQEALVVFSISKEYVELRRRLGVALS